MSYMDDYRRMGGEDEFGQRKPMNTNETEGYTDELGYPTRAYIFAVCDAIREAGYEPDLMNTDVDDGKAWVTVRTHSGESLTLTWALAEWTNGPDGQPYHVGGQRTRPRPQHGRPDGATKRGSTIPARPTSTTPGHLSLSPSQWPTS